MKWKIIKVLNFWVFTWGKVSRVIVFGCNRESAYRAYDKNYVGDMIASRKTSTLRIRRACGNARFYSTPLMIYIHQMRVCVHPSYLSLSPIKDAPVAAREADKRSMSMQMSTAILNSLNNWSSWSWPANKIVTFRTIRCNYFNSRIQLRSHLHYGLWINKKEEKEIH